MPTVFCGLLAFEATPDVPTSSAIASEFIARCDPALGDGPVEVYRLQKLSASELLHPGDQIACLPAWHWDMDSLDRLSGELEDTKAQLDELQLRHERAASTLATLSAAGAPGAALAEAAAAADAARPTVSIGSETIEDLSLDSQPVQSKATAMQASVQPASPGGSTARRGRGASMSADNSAREVQLLRQQLAERDAQLAEEKQTQQKLRADLIELRHQSHHLMQLVCSGSGPVESGKRPALVAGQAAQRANTAGSPSAGRSRAAGSSTPQTVRSSPGASYGRNGGHAGGMRPGTRPRSVQPRSGGSPGTSAGHHSAGPPSLRHRRLGVGDHAGMAPAA